MAFRRILSHRPTLVAKRYQPSFAYINIVHKDDHKNHPLNHLHSHPIPDNLFQQRSFATRFSSNSSSGLGVLLQDRGCPKLSVPPNHGVSCCRYMSSGSMANVIDNIHAHPFFFGFVLAGGAAVLVRVLTVSIFVHQLQKDLDMGSRLEEIRERVQARSGAKYFYGCLCYYFKGYEAEAVAEGQKEEQKLFKEFGVTKYNPLRGPSVMWVCCHDGLINIFLVAEMVWEYKFGGEYWYLLDLSDHAKYTMLPDTLGIFPSLWTLTYYLTVGVKMADRSDWTASSQNVGWAVAAFMVPWTLHLPRAPFVYWTAANLFFFTYALVRDPHGVKKALGVSKIFKSCSK